MTVYVLCGYLSPSESAPTFLIPIFTRHGSNELFAQNLNTDGTVKEFLPIKASLFYGVSEYPSAATKMVNEAGVFAYWKENGGILFGELNEITTLLEGHITDDPFANLEIGSVLGDDNLRSEAINSIAELFPNREIAGRWRTQEISSPTFHDYRKTLDSIYNSKTSDDTKSQDFISLTSDLEPKIWITRWTSLWSAKFKSPQLEELVFWWTDLGPGKLPIAGQLYSILVRQGRDTRIPSYAVKWLLENDIAAPGWIQILYNLNSQLPRDANSELLTMCREKLVSSLDKNLRHSSTWASVWYYVWRRSSNRLDCLSLASLAWNKNRTVSRSFADFVIDPALSDPNCPEDIYDAAEFWLARDMKSIVLWASIFIRVYKHRPNPVLAELAESWLSYAGGNVNIWYDLWILLSDRIETRDHYQMGLQWLSRSRWDLSSWPKVFNYLAMKQMGQTNTERLIALGVGWKNYQTNFPNNVKKIEKALSYLSAT